MILRGDIFISQQLEYFLYLRFYEETTTDPFLGAIIFYDRRWCQISEQYAVLLYSSSQFKYLKKRNIILLIK